MVDPTLPLSRLSPVGGKESVARFDGATLMAAAAGGDPVALGYALTMVEGWPLTFDLFRVFLPKPKYTISGPGGGEPCSAGRRPATTTAPPLLHHVQEQDPVLP